MQRKVKVELHAEDDHWRVVVRQDVLRGFGKILAVQIGEPHQSPGEVTELALIKAGVGHTEEEGK